MKAAPLETTQLHILVEEFMYSTTLLSISMNNSAKSKWWRKFCTEEHSKFQWKWCFWKQLSCTFWWRNFLDTSTLINFSIFRNNSANNDGGGIHVLYSNLNFNGNSTFITQVYCWSKLCKTRHSEYHWKWLR